MPSAEFEPDRRGGGRSIVPSEQRARGALRPATRRAYGRDLARARRLGERGGLANPASSPTATCAATRPRSPNAGSRKRAVARKLAAVRASTTASSQRARRPRTQPTCCPPRSPSQRAAAGARPRRCRRAARADPGLATPARDPRPGDVRARLLVRAARRRDRRPRRSATLDFEAETVRVPGKGSKDAGRAGRRAAPSAPCDRYLETARPALAGRRSSRRCSSRAAAAASPPPTYAAGSRSGSARRRSRAGSRRTRCATPSPPICSRAGRTCARSRSCSVTRASRPRRSTPGSSRRGFASSTNWLTRARSRARCDVDLRRNTVWKPTSRQSSSTSCGAATRRRATRRRASASSSPTRRWSSSSPAGWPPACPRTSRRRTSISYGLVGLIGAIERFDTEREIKFETFAVSRDQGRDHRRAALARLGAALGPHQAREVEERPPEARGEARRAPTEEEMAEKLEHRAVEPSGRPASRSPTPRSSRSTTSGRSPTPTAAARSRCSTRSGSRRGRSRRRRSTPPSSRTASPTRSRRCPSASGS